MLPIIMYRELIARWRRTRLSRAQFNELEVSIPTRSLVDCITIMSEFEFSVHTTELSALLGLAGRLRHELVTLLLCVLGVATCWGEGSVGNAQTFFLARAHLYEEI